MAASPASVTRRKPEEIMRLERLGSMHQSRLSFMRILLRNLATEKWQIHQTLFDIDQSGVGRAVYTCQGPKRSYSLIAFAHEIPAEKRSDRVIAEAWDATFCLFDGIPLPEDIDRLEKNVPLQESGRITETELCLSRANRSVRLWNYVVESLASGQQPKIDQIQKVGYLMRTTAVYGSGKFGAADREILSDRSEMKAPFQAEMLTVYLIRNFVLDLVQHMANEIGGRKTVDLAPQVARQLGIGNSTGLGMAPFIINHPVLFNNWMVAREEAIARVRSIKFASEAKVLLFSKALKLSHKSIATWTSEHPVQRKKLGALHKDIKYLTEYINGFNWNQAQAWDQLFIWAKESLSIEGQEWLNSLILEPHAELVDSLEATLADNSNNAFCIDGSRPVGDIRSIIEKVYSWALEIDWSKSESSAHTWYTSEEKLEPRLGERFTEKLEPYERPLAPGRDAVLAYNDLRKRDKNEPIATFLLEHPEHRHALRRAQICNRTDYGEIQDNTIAANLFPVDMLRAKLSFFGATHFDPRSDRWVRITMFNGAPYPSELAAHYDDLWIYQGV